MRRRRPVLALALVAPLALGACAGAAEDPEASPTDRSDVEEPTGTPEPPAEPDEPEEQEPDDDGQAGDPADLPGEPFDVGPAEGASLAVVGVDVDDVLYVRTWPGVRFEAVAELGPTAVDVPALGRSRQLDDGSVWVEVEAEGVSGWAGLVHLAYLGVTQDVTATLGGLPTGTDLAELARQVAQLRNPGASEGEGALEVTVVRGPVEGDLPEITVDVLGLMDDSVLGERLNVVTQPDGDAFTVRGVEATALCARGVTDDGLCL